MRRRCSALGAAWVALLAPSVAFAHAGSAGGPLPTPAAYFELGVTHILSGFDHLAFLAGLVVMQRSLRQLVWAVTAFSAAHCVTLAAAALAFIAPDARWVEPAIALSIAYVGIENLCLRPEGARIRLALVFGLLHGCGFGGALLELGLPDGAQAAWTLGCFSLGVEAGQLAVVAALYAGARAIARRGALRARVVPLVNAALVVAGLGWAVERGLELGTGTGMGTGEDGLPRSVFPERVAESDARVEALCEVFQRLPRRRRAECAGRAPGIDLASECERGLGAALASGALRLDAAATEQCLQQMKQRYQGCAWVDESYRAPLAACRRFASGTLAADKPCRSSLECVDGLHCAGVGPLDRGVCAPPKTAGERCELAVDPLAAYVQHDADESHPECAGRCLRHRCTNSERASAAAGEARERFGVAGPGKQVEDHELL
jgi:hydrogenase/urease accessory protein HupE